MKAMLHDGKAWWIEQMLSLLPPRLRRSDADDVDALVIEPSDDGTAGEGSPQAGGGRLPPQAAVGQLRRRRRTERLGSFRLDGKGLIAARQAAEAAGRPEATHLISPPGLLMEKHIVLPLAAEREIEGVVAYAMDRETPFTADEVWWSIAVERRDAAEEKLALRLSVVPRRALADLLGLLEHAGLRPTTLVAAAGDGTHRHIRLAAGGKASWRARTMPLAAAACALLALGASAVPFLRQAMALSAVEDRIAALKPLVDQADALRRRIDGGGTGGDILAAEAERLGDPLKVLAATTAVLPDDTYLTEFAMRQRQVSLVGQSADAAQLIGALAHDASFRDPAFAAPVTRMKDANRDLFSIKVEALP